MSDAEKVLEEVLAMFDEEVEYYGTKVKKYGVLGVGAMYARDRDRSRVYAERIRRMMEQR